MSYISDIADLSSRIDRATLRHTPFDLMTSAVLDASPGRLQAKQTGVNFWRLLIFAIVFNIAVSFGFALVAVKVFEKDFATVLDIFPLAFVFIDVVISLPIILAVFTTNGLYGLIVSIIRVAGAYVLYLQVQLGLIIFSVAFQPTTQVEVVEKSLSVAVPSLGLGMSDTVTGALITSGFYAVTEFVKWRANARIS